MKNLLITGGCGFIGTNFIRYLLEQPDFEGRIVNLDLLTYAGNSGNLWDVEKKYKDRYLFVRGDICDESLLDQLFKENAIDSVCHLAAESHVDRSILGPKAFIKTNIEGTFALLETVRRYRSQVKRFHHVSTDEVYGSLAMNEYFTERTPYDPSSPYSASKASSDHLVKAYYKTYQIPVTISNCSNNYGPFQFPEKLIPLMLMNAIRMKPLPVYGDGRQIRDWLFVEDHVCALWLIMRKGRIGETYNIGGNEELCNINVVEKICEILGQLRPSSSGIDRKSLISFVKDRPGHDRRYAIDFTKIKSELGWRPMVDFHTGLRKTVDWYLSHLQWVEEIESGDYLQWIEKQYGGKIKGE